jgi:PIN domain nuclease of toxin-antitoxin system
MSTALTTIEPLYMVDTMALIWWLTQDRKLGMQAAQVFDAAERGETRLLISAVAIAELYYANKKFRLFHDFAALYQKLRTSPYIRFTTFDAEHVLDFDVDTDVPEMHDRIITGLARRFGAPLLTSDPKIITSRLVTTVW